MRRMVFFMNLSDKHTIQLHELAPDWEIICDIDIPMELIKDAEIISGPNDHINKICFNEDIATRWIHSWGAGINSLPIQNFKENNIMLSNSRGVHAYPVSEMIFAMMLSLTRKLNSYARNQLQKQWEKNNNLLEIHGKTIGILGIGAIGEETARLAKAFGMKVLGYRHSAQLSPYVDYMYDFEHINSLFNQSDFVINTLPLTKKTLGFMGEKQFNHMKNTAFYINIGRGATTDEAALINALQKQTIAGAGLDAFVQEPLPSDSALWDFKNVIITPHDAGETEFYNDRVMEIFTSNLKDFLTGKPPGINLVDLNLGY